MAHEATDVIRGTEGGTSIDCNVYAVQSVGVTERYSDDTGLVRGSDVVIHKRDEAFAASSENVDVEAAAPDAALIVNYASDNTELAVGDVVAVPATPTGLYTGSLAFRRVLSLDNATQVTLSSGPETIPTTAAGAAVLKRVVASNEVFINEVDNFQAHQGFLNLMSSLPANCNINDAASGHKVSLLSR